MKPRLILKRLKRKSKKIAKKLTFPLLIKIVPRKFKTIKWLTFFHFLFWSELNHINRNGLTLALNGLNTSPAIIVETGTSAWGTDSTRLWNSYVSSFGGNLYSVDIRPEPREVLGNLGPFTKLFVDDSVNFLKNLHHHNVSKVDLVYLDSFDIDWQNPYPAMKHGLLEFEAIEKYLKPGSIIVIDDTPSSKIFIPEEAHEIVHKVKSEIGVVPGKGALVLSKIMLKPNNFKIIYHHYNLVFRVVS